MRKVGLLEVFFKINDCRHPNKKCTGFFPLDSRSSVVSRNTVGNFQVPNNISVNFNVEYLFVWLWFLKWHSITYYSTVLLNLKKMHSFPERLFAINKFLLQCHLEQFEILNGANALPYLYQVHTFQVNSIIANMYIN